MSFDNSKFLASKFQPRTKNFQVPQLKDFFSEGEAVWTVRGLEASELAAIRLARYKRRNQVAALHTLSSFTATEAHRRAMLEQIINLTGEVEAELAGRLEMLCIASVEPKINMEVAIKLSKMHPTVFWTLTDNISTLTDEGAVVGE
jgi:hypothetical protein